MRRFNIILVGLAVTLLSAQPLAADKKADKAAFRVAYAEYQEALKGDSRSAALQAAKAAYDAGVKYFGPDHKNVAALTVNLAQLVDSTHKNEKIQKALLQAVKIYEREFGEDATQLIDPLMELARFSTRHGRLGRSKTLYKRALKIAEKHEGPTSIIAGQITREIGETAYYDAQSPFGIKYLNKAEEIFVTHEGPGIDYELARTRFSRGKYYLARGEKRSAAKDLEATLAALEKVAPKSRLKLNTHAFLVEIYEKMNKRDKATAHCRAIGAATPHDPNREYLPIYQVQPRYPIAEANRGENGWVVVSLTVDDAGFAKNLKVVDSEGGKGFSREALKAVEKFRYAPKFVNGKPVAAENVTYKFVFKMAD